MDHVLIPCPKCGKGLRLRDRALLGRTGKCPNCGHRFLLEEPEEVELELAESEHVAVGRGATWVPDERPRPDGPLAEPAAQPFAPPVVQTADVDSEGGLERLREIQRRGAQRRKVTLIAGGTIGALLAGIVVWAIASGAAETPPEQPAGRKPPTRNTAWEAQVRDAQANLETVEAIRPPAGEPISLQYVPFGASLVVHLRPAELWKPGSLSEIVRAGHEPLADWIETQFREYCLFEPAEIDELLVCLYLESRDRPAQATFVVHLAEDQSPATFVQKIRGTPTMEYGTKVYLTEARAFLVPEGQNRTFVSVPRERVEDMITAIAQPGLPSDGIQALLDKTDRRRHLTVLFDPRDIDTFEEQLAPAEAHPLLELARYRFFDDERIETVAWSLHFGDPAYDRFYSEIVLRNRTGLERSNLTPDLLRRDLERRLARLPEELLGAIEKMDPQHAGPRKLIGRLPAMLQAFAAQTIVATSETGDRSVRMATVLPRVAGPNLAAASLLAWKESLGTDFGKPKPAAPSKKLPELVADRLKLTVEVDFRQTPLQKAFEELAEGIQVKVEIDGDALKDAGYTKNMQQTFNLGEVPVARALHEIIKQYQGMAVVIDEKTKTLIVTTEKFAAQKGLKPFNLAP